MDGLGGFQLLQVLVKTPIIIDLDDSKQTQGVVCVLRIFILTEHYSYDHESAV